MDNEANGREPHIVTFSLFFGKPFAGFWPYTSYHEEQQHFSGIYLLSNKFRKRNAT